MSFDFRFPSAEDQHWADAAAAFEELLTLLANLLTVSNKGFGHIGALATFDKHDKRTLQAGLLTRSFKAISCAINLALRGYYTTSITLSRSVIENHLILWDLQHHSKRVVDFYNDLWPRGRNFEQIFEEIDRKIQEAFAAKGTPPPWSYKKRMGTQGLYGELSEFAHPRPKGVRLEFDLSGTRLMSGPEFLAKHCSTALLYALHVALMNLEHLIEFVPDVDGNQQWRQDASRLRDSVGPWLEQQIATRAGTGTAD